MIRRILFGLIIFFFLLFPFGQLGRVVFGNFHFYLIDITAGLFVCTWFVSKPKFTHPLIFPFVSFLSASAFSLLLNLNQVNQESQITGALYLLRFLIYVFLGFAVFDLASLIPSYKNTIYWITLVSGFFATLFGLLQYLLFPDLRTLSYFGWDDHYFRAAGTFLDTGFLGIIIVLYLLSKFSADWVGSQFKSRWFVYIGIFVLAATFSRASILAFIVGLFILNILKIRVVYTLKLLAILGLIVFLLPKPGGEGVNLGRTSTISFRLENYQESFEIFKKNPLLGTGFNLYSNYKENIDDKSHSAFGSDSSLLFVLAATGIIGIVTYLSLVWQVVILGWKKRNSLFGLTLLSGTGALITHSFFHNSLFYIWVMGWFFTIVALTASEKSENQ